MLNKQILFRASIAFSRRFVNILIMTKAKRLLRSLLHLSEAQLILVGSGLRRLEEDGKDFLWGNNGRQLKHVLDPGAPWRQIQVVDYQIPGMISREEKQYYTFLGQFYTGEDFIVELGPWLGCSTSYIIDGLKNNSHFVGRKLYVFDDFVWRSSWMDRHYSEPDTPQNHGDFMYLFEKYAILYRESLEVSKVRIGGPMEGELEEFDSYKEIPLLVWNKGPIEMIFVDVGRTMLVNETWWSLLSPYFIPSKTLVVMQDWQTHKDVPQKWYNQVKDFTDSKKQLELVHELANGNAAAFLFKG